MTYLRLYVCRWCYDVTGNAFWTWQLLLQWVFSHPSSLFYLNSILAVGWKGNVSQEQNTFFFVKENLWALACLLSSSPLCFGCLCFLIELWISKQWGYGLAVQWPTVPRNSCMHWLFIHSFVHASIQCTLWSTYPELTLCRFWRHTVNEDMVLTFKEYL